MKRLFFGAACVLQQIQALTLPSTTKQPVIIIPGDGSNQLEAKLDKPKVPHFYCSKKADWFRLWLSLT